MKLAVLAVGRMKGPERDLADRYGGRLAKAARPLGLDWRGVSEIAEARGGSASARMAAEADALLAKASGMADAAAIVLLDERGDAVSSEEFAAMIGRTRDDGRPALAFALGGPDGHGNALRDAAMRSVSFGRLTWPHQLARAMLMEQIYRATTILAGHPYHRA